MVWRDLNNIPYHSYIQVILYGVGASGRANSLLRAGDVTLLSLYDSGMTCTRHWQTDDIAVLHTSSQTTYGRYTGRTRGLALVLIA